MGDNKPKYEILALETLGFAPSLERAVERAAEYANRTSSGVIIQSMDGMKRWTVNAQGLVRPSCCCRW